MITQNNSLLNVHHLVFFISVMGVSAIFTGTYLLGNSFNEKLFPNTYINSVDVSQLTLSEALTRLEQQKYELPEHTVTLKVDDISLASSSSELEHSMNYQQAIQDTYTNQHKNNSFKTAIAALSAFFTNTEIIAPTTYSQDKVENMILELNKKVELTGENPSVTLYTPNSSSSLQISEGIPGRTIQTQETVAKILSDIQETDYEIEALVASTSSILSEQDVIDQTNRAIPYVGEKLVVSVEDTKFYLSDQDLLTMVNPLGDYNTEVIIDFIKTWTEKINSEPQNASFKYDKDTLEVIEFVPHKDGLTLDSEPTINNITNWLQKFEAGEFKADTTEEFEVEAEVKRVSPEVTLDQTNDLGINERIGFGESYYHHSIINRVHNVGITAERISYTIIPPQNEFSFNKTLGEVSSRTGYRSAYVIQGGKTVLGDGGGVCQVSSTLFRSVLDAGLDVTKRLQHSYRVSYYELNSQPGFDATVYSGDVDFRFINDTDHHIIILTHVDEDNRYMNIEIYGTDDGRTAEIYDYKKWGFVGPPAAEYYPTNELPTGVTKQIDWSVSGIKTEFKHTVKDKDGKVIHDDTYYSNYRPWSAKYMVGI